MSLAHRWRVWRSLGESAIRHRDPASKQLASIARQIDNSERGSFLADPDRGSQAGRESHKSSHAC